MLLRLIAVAAASSASAAFAQVVYEPVTVQYGGQNPYYYAGSNPAIHEAARFPHVEGAHWGRVPGYAFVSPTRAVVERHTRVFTDAFGTTNAAPYGLTPDDVVDEANARLPKYFRKADLLQAGEVRGTIRIVPAMAAGPTPAMQSGDPAKVNPRTMPPGSIFIRPLTPGLHGGRSPVYVFPRGMLDRKIGDVVAGKDGPRA